MIHRGITETIASPLVSSSEMEMRQLNAHAVQFFRQILRRLNGGIFTVPKELSADKFKEFLWRRNVGSELCRNASNRGVVGFQCPSQLMIGGAPHSQQAQPELLGELPRV